jgi:hypothetical protein
MFFRPRFLSTERSTIMITHTLIPSPTSTWSCPRCGKIRSPLAYARAIQVHAYIPEFHRLERALLVTAYQQKQLTRFRSLLDYDQVCAWARTTPRTVVGIAGHAHEHPFRRFLNDVDPSSTTGRPRWVLFLSACDALKRFAHIPHTANITLFECFRISPTGVTYTVYCPLPSWTRGILACLEALPSGTKITREHFLTLLRAAV